MTQVRTGLKEITRMIGLPCVVLWFVFVAIAIPGPLLAQTGWKAVAKTDAVPVYAQMSQPSTVVRSLHKGEAVVVDLEFMSAEADWCAVREAEGKLRVGYVACSALEREPIARPTYSFLIPPPAGPDEVPILTTRGSMGSRAPLSPPARGTGERIKRSEGARREFMRQAGYPHGRPGYVIDHIVPLACGGEDSPRNMQWQTIAEAKAKDKIERKGCK